jgi:hypothetical protein
MRAGGVGLNLQAADTVIIYDTVRVHHFYSNLHRWPQQILSKPINGHLH